MLSFLVLDSILYLDSLTLIFKEIFVDFFNPQRLEKLSHFRAMQSSSENTRRKCLEETKSEVANPSTQYD